MWPVGEYGRMDAVSRVVIEGRVDDEVRAGIERCLAIAIASLEIEQIAVHITASNRRLPKGLVAGAGPDGIWLRSSVLREDRVLVASILLEEAAHLKLIELGTVDGLTSFTGALVNEFFATWYAFHELLKVQPSIVDRYDDGPLPAGNATPRVGYVVGAFLGAAAAGIPAAQRRLDTWLVQGTLDPAVRSAVLQFRSMAESMPSPLEMAISLAKRFPRRGEMV